MGIYTKQQFQDIISQNQGIDPNQLISDIQAAGHTVEGYVPPKEQQKSLLTRAADGIDKIMGPASEFIAGTSAPAVGSVIGSGVEAATDLYTQVSGKKATGILGTLQEKKPFTQSAEQLLGPAGGKAETAKTLAFSTLEMYPGGGAAKTLVKKLPYGEKAIAAFSKVIDHIPANLREQAIKQYSEALAATGKEMKATSEKIIPGLLERGQSVGFGGLEGLAQKASGLEDVAGKRIDLYLKNAPQTIKTTIRPVLGALETLKNKYIVDGKIIRPEAVNTIEKTQETIATLSKKGEVSQKSVVALRRIFDEHFSTSKGLDDITQYTKKSERAAGDAIRAEIAKSSPDFAKLNSEYSFWRNVRQVAETTAEKQKSQVKGGLSSIISSAAGTVAGASAGQGYAEKAIFAGIGGYLGNKGVEFFKGPAFKSMSAVQKNKLANAIAKGSFKEADLIVSKALAGTRNSLPSNSVDFQDSRSLETQ